MSAIELNDVERRQLGTEHNGIAFIPDLQSWRRFRQGLVAHSSKRNPGFFDPELAAYTPGETEALLEHPRVKRWHREVRTFQAPKGTELLVLVPCAASKPWRDSPNMAHSKLYRAYNRIASEIAAGDQDLPRAFFLTVSEPLGIVPETRWTDFPPYDNPGLFADDFLRTGLVKSQWDKTFLGKRHRLPFDRVAARRCFERLGNVIGDVLAANPLPVLAMVDQPPAVTTHTAMLAEAVRANPALQSRLTRVSKRALPRIDPYEHIRKTLADYAGQAQPSVRRRPQP